MPFGNLYYDANGSSPGAGVLFARIIMGVVPVSLTAADFEVI